MSLRINERLSGRRCLDEADGGIREWIGARRISLYPALDTVRLSVVRPRLGLDSHTTTTTLTHTISLLTEKQDAVVI